MGLIETIGIKIGEKLIEFLPTLFKRKPIEFLDAPKIDEIAIELVKSWLSVDCFFVVIAHNGKKKKDNKYKYISIVAGYHEEWILKKLVVTNYSYFEVDDEYRKLFDDIKRNVIFDVDAEEGAVDSKLYTNIRYEGLKHLRFFFLKENEDTGKFWYAVAGTNQANETFSSDDHKQKFFIAINKIKGILKNH